jgi:hypothetical protein
LTGFGIKLYRKKPPMIAAQEKNLTWLPLRKKAYEGMSGQAFFLEILGLKFPPTHANFE